MFEGKTPQVTLPQMIEVGHRVPDPDEPQRSSGPRLSRFIEPLDLNQGHRMLGGLAKMHLVPTAHSDRAQFGMHDGEVLLSSAPGRGGIEFETFTMDAGPAFPRIRRRRTPEIAVRPQTHQLVGLNVGCLEPEASTAIFAIP